MFSRSLYDFPCLLDLALLPGLFDPLVGDFAPPDDGCVTVEVVEAAGVEPDDFRSTPPLPPLVRACLGAVGVSPVLTLLRPPPPATGGGDGDGCLPETPLPPAPPPVLLADVVATTPLTHEASWIVGDACPVVVVPSASTQLGDPPAVRCRTSSPGDNDECAAGGLLLLLLLQFRDEECIPGGDASSPCTSSPSSPPTLASSNGDSMSWVGAEAESEGIRRLDEAPGSRPDTFSPLSKGTG
jgi:hypothetical protein